MTKQQMYLYFNIPKALSILDEEEQELLLFLLLYDYKKGNIAKHFKITISTLAKRIKLLKTKLYNECIKGYNGEIDDFLLFEKVKEFMDMCNKRENKND